MKNIAWIIYLKIENILLKQQKTENVSMLKYKKSLFSKILNKIEKILKRNHRQMHKRI